MSVTPLASRSSQRNCSTGTGLATCQLAPLENFHGAYHHLGIGIFGRSILHMGQRFADGVVERLDLAAVPIEPEQSVIQIK